MGHFYTVGKVGHGSTEGKGYMAILREWWDMAILRESGTWLY